jgi:hypothetical protein
LSLSATLLSSATTGGAGSSSSVFFFITLGDFTGSGAAGNPGILNGSASADSVFVTSSILDLQKIFTQY